MDVSKFHVPLSIFLFYLWSSRQAVSQSDFVCSFLFFSLLMLTMMVMMSLGRTTYPLVPWVSCYVEIYNDYSFTTLAAPELKLH
jgi:hypothetical protein